MGNLNFQKHIDRGREQLIDELLPDTCELYPVAGTGVTISGAGVLSQTPASARVWRGTTSIPCRADVARSFKNESTKHQTVVVDEFNLELPFDVAVEESDNVVIGGKRFEIRKLKALSEWDFTREALIMAISIDYDNP